MDAHTVVARHQLMTIRRARPYPLIERCFNTVAGDTLPKSPSRVPPEFFQRQNCVELQEITFFRQLLEQPCIYQHPQAPYRHL